MTTVPSRELKNRLGKYLQLVREGEAIRVTDRGKPVAIIVPSGRENTLPAPKIEKLLRKGGITFGTGQRLSEAPPARLKPGKSIAEMVAADRR